MFKAGASQTVTYRRGALSVSVKASIGASLVETPSAAGGVTFDRTNLDFCINAADLVLGGVAVEPVDSDTITYAGGVYVVARPDQSTAAWYWSNDYSYRIHTRYKGAA
jgi:hypothetical protein